MIRILEDIFHNPNRTEEKITHYQNISQEKETEIKEFVFSKYKSFIKISKEIRVLTDCFVHMKNSINEFGEIFKNVENLVSQNNEESRLTEQMQDKYGTDDSDSDDDGPQLKTTNLSLKKAMQDESTLIIFKITE